MGKRESEDIFWLLEYRETSFGFYHKASHEHAERVSLSCLKEGKGFILENDHDRWIDVSADIMTVEKDWQKHYRKEN